MKPNIVPVLQYDAAPAAIKWLVHALGMTADRGGVRFGASPIAVRPRATATGAWSGLRQGAYVSVPGSSEMTKQDPDGYLWAVGSDDMGAQEGEVAVVPELRCRSLAAATAWLRTHIGFEPRFEVPGPDGKPIHVELGLGAGTIFIGPHSTGGGPFADVSQFVNLIVDDPDAHHARAKAAGANVVIPPRDTPFGARFYAVRDPEQMLWWISTYRPAKPGTAPPHS